MNRTGIAAAWPGRALALVVGLSVLGSGPVRADFEFVRGDVDIDGRVNLVDSFWVIAHLFVGTAEDLPCLDAADVDDSGHLDLADAIYLLNYLFRSGPPPVGPYPLCGTDGTADRLRCEAYGDCPAPLEIAGIPLYYDGLVFVVDRSTSMEEHWETTTGEVLRLVERLREPMRFGIIFSSAGSEQYPTHGAADVASAENREKARMFVTAASSCLGGGTCHQHALVLAIHMLQRMSIAYAYPVLPQAPDWAIVYISDGGGTCQGADELRYWRQTIESVATMNDGNAVIHAIAVGEPDPVHEGLLRELADRNRGQYARLHPE